MTSIINWKVVPRFKHWSPLFSEDTDTTMNLNRKLTQPKIIAQPKSFVSMLEKYNMLIITLPMRKCLREVPFYFISNSLFFPVYFSTPIFHHSFTVTKISDYLTINLLILFPFFIIISICLSLLYLPLIRKSYWAKQILRIDCVATLSFWNHGIFSGCNPQFVIFSRILCTWHKSCIWNISCHI